MKNIEFYEEVNSEHDNCIAIFTEPDPYRAGYKGLCREGLSGTFFHDNSAVSIGGIPVGYLESECEKVSEERVREIHPRLIERLERAPSGDFWKDLMAESEAMWGRPPKNP